LFNFTFGGPLSPDERPLLPYFEPKTGLYVNLLSLALNEKIDHP